MVKKVAYCRKTQRDPFRLIKRFLQTESFNKIQAVLFERIQKFLQKRSYSAEKTQKGDPLVFSLLLEACENFKV